MSSDGRPGVGVDASQACPRCDAELYLVATVPHAGWEHLGGRRPVALCPRCDADNPAAHGLLAFFAMYSTLGEDNLAEFNALCADWVAAETNRRTEVAPHALEADIAEWEADRRNGEPHGR